MTHYDDGTFRLSTLDWFKLIGLLAGHSVVVFCGLMFWANRIVSIEVRVSNVESTLNGGLAEVRSDIKEILKRTK